MNRTSHNHEGSVDTNGFPGRAGVRLALENGAVFAGRGFGAHVPASGEVVFNTAMSGYQEALTDPSYTGQILIMTASEIGNYGVNPEDIESDEVAVAGFVVRELSRVRSNHRGDGRLGQWLAEAGIPALHDVDTRAMVRMLREEGAMRGVIEPDARIPASELVARARSLDSMAGSNLAEQVSPDGPDRWHEGLGEWTPGSASGSDSSEDRTLVVLALDCGAKRNIYRHLVERGCEVRIAPHDLKADEINEMISAGEIDGLFVSNGPGDPAAVETTIETLREVAGKAPTFGICLGHQLLALALGATTYKLRFGHRGANQPVRNLLTGRVEITSQNHGFCVEEASLVAAGGEVTHRHLNDQTVAGFRHRDRPIFSVQYHPEASPGPHDSSYLFDAFVRTMRNPRVVGAADFVGTSS
ncbi:MAG: glutamine-hydrolyzing carbamoyl-phosphate synthase small subunit [Phycisphaerales bacterium]|nr:glutamine-hydrolyzing carbamoyl-phosphate synthase small subunit [Phycisphaerales bacterium]